MPSRLVTEDEQMKVTFTKSNLSGRAITWAPNLQLQNTSVFGLLTALKSLLSQSFEPPRDEFRTLTQLLKVKQVKRDVHMYAQHVLYRASCMVANTIPDF